jgi:hypothetical protein
MIEGDNVRCDCCGTELMARIVGKTLVIRDRRHGVRHVAVIPLNDLLDKAGFTVYARQESETGMRENIRAVG